MRIALVSTALRSGCPPIGLVYLASYVHRHTPHKVDIIDANCQDIFRFDYNPYEVIGINAMTANYGKATHLARHIRIMHAKKVIVIGGVHISTCPESQAMNTFDSMIIGEGEKSFLTLLVDYERGTVKNRYENEPLDNLDELTYPDWDLLDSRYFTRQFNTTFAEWGIEGWLLTSRGCPYRCRFCSTTRFWEKLRYHSAGYVAKCIEDLKEKGATHIQIWDDLFTVNANRLYELSPILKKSGINFNCQPRINTINDSMCQILKDSNVSLCIFGFESGNNRMLKYLKNDKNLTVTKSKQAIKLCRKYGLDAQGSIIFGSPTETLPEMLGTLRFMLWCLFNGAQRLWAFVATPFPATEFWSYLPEKFSYSQLSHHNMKRPLLLDKTVKVWQFRIVMFLAHRIEDMFKVKKLWKIVKSAKR